jgi:hypothetical protein
MSFWRRPESILEALVSSLKWILVYTSMLKPHSLTIS